MPRAWMPGFRPRPARFHTAALPPILPGLLLLALAACSPGQPHEGAIGPSLRAETIPTRPDPPKSPPPNQCWDSDTVPAVVETVTKRTLVSPAIRDATGRILKPAVWNTASSLHMVQNSSRVWFRVPCAAVETRDFWASVQRALKARGYYLAPVTGQDDATTGEAIRRYQAGHGLDSPILSLAAARDFGLLPTPLNQLN